MLEFDGALDLSVNGKAAHLTGNGNLITLEVERVGSFLRASGLFSLGGVDAMRRLAAKLEYAGLTLRITSRGKTLLILGRQAHGGIQGRLLRLPHLQVEGSGALFRLLLP